MESQSLSMRGDAYFILGESIWSSILSKLPLNEATRTSALSRAWRNAWAQIPHLHINYNTIKYQEDWEDFNESGETTTILNDILARHEGPIQRCTIDAFCLEGVHDYIDEWIRMLIKRSIGEFTLTSYLLKSKNHGVPADCLFTCKTLSKLELRGCDLRAFKDMSRFTCGNLRRLTLDSSHINIRMIQSLLKQCSNLENLILHRCYIDEYADDNGGTILRIDAPHLKKLKISELRVHSGKDFVWKDITWEQLQINGPHLKSLTLGDVILRDVKVAVPIRKFSCHIEQDWCPYVGVPCENLVPIAFKIKNLLSNISIHIKILDLSLPTYKCLLAGLYFRPLFMNLSFKELTKLTLVLNLREKIAADLLTAMLRCCPKLTELRVKSTNTHLPPETQNVWTVKKPLGCSYWEEQEEFECFKTTLQLVTIKDFCEFDMGFVFHVLKRAQVLKDLSIRYWYYPSQEELMSLCRVEKASKEAKVTIINTIKDDESIFYRFSDL